MKYHVSYKGWIVVEAKDDEDAIDFVSDHLYNFNNPLEEDFEITNVNELED